jgi:hypothetical protein
MHHITRTITLILALTVLLLGSNPALGGSPSRPQEVLYPNTWAITKLDDGGAVGSHSSLALDSNGRPHISYCSVYPNTYWKCKSVMYAYYDGTTWASEEVAPMERYGEAGFETSPALALDGADRPHIGYLAPSDTWQLQAIRYAYHDGASWQIETVVDGGYNTRFNPFVSLALDGSGRPHLGYIQDDHLIYAHFDGAAWVTQTVTSGAGLSHDMVLDGSGRPRLAYVQHTTGELLYAFYDGSSWSSEVADSTLPGYIGLRPSLALDSAERPHIMYWDIANENPKYVYHDGSDWQADWVDPGTLYTGLHPSLALDAGDRPHALYCAYPELGNYFCQELVYAYHDGANWTTQVVVSGMEYVNDRASLALDAAGNPHVSYYDDFPEDNLLYAYYDGSTWQMEVADGQRDVGFYSSLALDSNNRSHISYRDSREFTYGNLKHAWYNTGTIEHWNVETADSSGITGYYTSLAVDSTDGLHISYRDVSGVRYAYHDGTTWQAQTVDGSAGAGYSGAFNTSLALDDLDRPHISYYQSGPHSLTYAYWSGTVWITETVDGDWNAGYNSSLALDGAGRPHISYLRGSTEIRYAYYNGAAWQVEIVEDNVAGDLTSLALDGSDRPHIVYTVHGPTIDELTYAYFDGSTWHIEVVDTVGTPGRNGGEGSLALDDLGRPHISYADVYNDALLKYTYFDGAAWHIEVVERGYAQGISLALDAFDNPRISYNYSYSDIGNRFELRYAVRTTYQQYLPVVDTRIDAWSGSKGITR